MQLEGKCAIVTGGATGIGRAVCLSLAREGASVVVNYSRSEKEAEQTARDATSAGGQGVTFKADVADEEKVKEMVAFAHDSFGRVDVLVNNAGYTQFIKHTELDKLTDEVWDRIFAVNVKGAFLRYPRRHAHHEGTGQRPHCQHIVSSRLNRRR